MIFSPASASWRSVAAASGELLVPLSEGRAELIDGRGVDAVLGPVVGGESRDCVQSIEEGGSGESAILQRGQVEESVGFVAVHESVHVEVIAWPCPSPQREYFVGCEIIGVQDWADVEADAALEPPAVGEDLDGAFPPAGGSTATNR